MDSCEPVEAAKAGNPTSIEGKESSADHVTRSSCARDSERHASFRDLKRWSPIRSYISFSLVLINSDGDYRVWKTFWSISN